MKVALDTLWASVVRTAVPAIVGALLTWLVGLGVEMDPEFGPALTSLLFAVFAFVYHLGIRLLETHVSPRFGWLLGSAKQPMIYAKADDAGVPVITAVQERPNSATVTVASGKALTHGTDVIA